MSIAVPSVTYLSQLSGVTWAIYEHLRADEQNRGLRMTFDRGTLDLMSPTQFHERVGELITRLVISWSDHCRIRLESGGLVTFRREDLAQALEPDKCFYVASLPLLRAHDEHDLQTAPLPDMVLEVDITTESRRRLPLYAALGIGEVWQWRDEELIVFVLNSAGQYEVRTASQALLGFPLDAARRALAARHTLGGFDLIEQFCRELK